MSQTDKHLPPSPFKKRRHLGFGVFLVIWSMSQTQYGGLPHKQQSLAGMPRYRRAILIPSGKDDPRGVYNPTTFNPMAKIYNSPPENVFKEIVQLDSNSLKEVFKI